MRRAKITPLSEHLYSEIRVILKSLSFGEGFRVRFLILNAFALFLELIFDLLIPIIF